MIVYLVLISAIFILPIITRSIIKDAKKADIYALRISVLLLFLVFALRAPSVGRDIPGYRDMYINFATNLRYDANTYWTEPGYELLEIFFGRVLRADWQVFLAFCSGVSVLSYYMLIKRYSKDPSLSLLIYILIGNMIFDISAVRNMLAVSICLFVVPLFERKGIWPAMIVTFTVILVATQIHSSAYIFYILYVIYKIPLNSITIFFYVSFPVFFFVLRGPIINWAINTFKNSVVDGGLSLGGNVILYFVILVFAIIILLLARRQNGLSIKDIGKTSSDDQKSFLLKDAFNDVDPSIMLSFRMVYAGTLFTIFTGSNTFVRMSQYGLIFTIILLPNLISRLEPKSKFLVKTMAIAFFAVYFYFLKVKTNELDFMPYIFFWNA